MNIIPAIDIIGGSCVRLVKGDYAQQTTYDSDPLVVAQRYEEAGLTRLHLVDLDGAKAGRIMNSHIIERIRKHTSLHIDVGGGVKSRDDVLKVLDSGADEVTIGSLSARDRDLTLSLLEEFSASRLILGADCIDGMIAVSGWQETTGFPVEEFVRNYVGSGFRTVVSTDISRDGMLNGPSLNLYRALLDATRDTDGVEIIASGGIRSIHDLQELKENGLSGAIIGKALFENFITLEELKEFIEKGERAC